MSVNIVILSMENAYPFGVRDEETCKATTVLVKQHLDFLSHGKDELRKKAKILKKIKYPFLINLETFLEEDNFIDLFYEYVPICLDAWITNIITGFISTIKTQLTQFTSFLTRHAISVKLNKANLGMDSKYNMKYFLGMNFTINDTVSTSKLLSDYERQIEQLFIDKMEGLKIQTKLQRSIYLETAQIQKRQDGKELKMQEDQTFMQRMRIVKQYVNEIKYKSPLPIKRESDARDRLKEEREARESKELKIQQSKQASNRERKSADREGLSTSYSTNQISNMNVSKSKSNSPVSSETRLPSLKQSEYLNYAGQYAKLGSLHAYGQEIFAVLEEGSAKISPKESITSLKSEPYQKKSPRRNHLESGRNSNLKEFKSKVSRAIQNSLKVIEGLKSSDQIKRLSKRVHDMP